MVNGDGAALRDLDPRAFCTERERRVRDQAREEIFRGARAGNVSLGEDEGAKLSPIAHGSRGHEHELGADQPDGEEDLDGPEIRRAQIDRAHAEDDIVRGDRSSGRGNRAPSAEAMRGDADRDREQGPRGGRERKRRDERGGEDHVEDDAGSRDPITGKARNEIALDDRDGEVREERHDRKLAVDGAPKDQQRRTKRDAAQAQAQSGPLALRQDDALMEHDWVTGVTAMNHAS